MKVLDSINKIIETYIFDAIFVCNGHYFSTFIPHFDGIERFEGEQMHSHDYRCASAFKGMLKWRKFMNTSNNIL